MVEQAFSAAFEEAMRRCGLAVMAAGCCVLVNARLCSVQRIMPHRKCA